MTILGTAVPVIMLVTACAPAPRPAPPVQNTAGPLDAARPRPLPGCPPAAPARVPARSRRLGAIAGTVVDQNCEPISGATIFARTGQQFSQAELSDERGRFAVLDLPPGEYAVAVFYLDSTLERGGVRVHAGAVLQVQLSMPPPARAAPRITRDLTAPAPAPP